MIAAKPTLVAKPTTSIKTLTSKDAKILFGESGNKAPGNASGILTKRPRLLSVTGQHDKDLKDLAVE